MQSPASPSSFRAAIFDFDGTLADTIPLITASFNAALSPILNRSWTMEEVVARFGVPDNEILRRELANHSPATLETARQKYFEHYEAEHNRIVAPFVGIPNLLDALRARQIPLGLMTGKGRLPAEISLRALGWQNCFDCVITGDDVTHQKPHPEGVLLVAQALGIVPQQCLYVGDAAFDIEAGREAQMWTVAAGWNEFQGQTLRDSKPDAWAKHPQDILEWFK